MCFVFIPCIILHVLKDTYDLRFEETEEGLEITIDENVLSRHAKGRKIKSCLDSVSFAWPGYS